MGLPLDRNEHKWIRDWLSADEYAVARVTLSSIQLLTIPILLCSYIYLIYIKNPNIRFRTESEATNPNVMDRKLRKCFRKTIEITTILTMIFSILSALTDFLNTLNVFRDIATDDLCTAISIIQNIFWISTKMAIYQVVLTRIQLAFWGSKYEANRTLMSLLNIFIVCNVIICIIGSLLSVKAIYFHTGRCLLIIPTWLILLPAFLDILCVTISLILVIKSIKNVMAQRDLQNQDKNMKLQHLVTKYILLSFIAIFFNIFSALWFGITDIAFFSFLDIFINPICLILMDIRYKTLYNCCCKCCHNGCFKLLNGQNMIKLEETQDQVVSSDTLGNDHDHDRVPTQTSIV